MEFKEIITRLKGETVVVNNNEERLLVDVEGDFIVLQGGNPQMKVTDFVPLSKVVKLIRADYATGASSYSLDVLVSGGDQIRNASY